MIGVFDSGVGGLCACKELRRLLPEANLAFLADRKNAPYGTKTKDALIRLVKKDICRLRDFGADRILIACCTASAIYNELDEESRRIAIPIIAPTARLLAKRGSRKSGEYRIAVIATDRTVKEKAFSKAIINAFISLENPSFANNYLQRVNVFEIPAQRLVSLVESGNVDGALTEEGRIYLDRLTERLRRLSPDALVLGCTHFTHLIREFTPRMPGTEIFSPALIGAQEAYEIMKENEEAVSEGGRCFYL